MINPKPFDSDELYDDCNSDPKQVTCFCGEVAFTVFNGKMYPGMGISPLNVSDTASDIDRPPHIKFGRKRMVRQHCHWRTKNCKSGQY